MTINIYKHEFVGRKLRHVTRNIFPILISTGKESNIPSDTYVYFKNPRTSRYGRLSKLAGRIAACPKRPLTNATRVSVSRIRPEFTSFFFVQTVGRR